jgi:putative membrane protein
MKDTPYSRFGGEKLILRDELAIDRTILANERTLLAYLRSGVALIIAGVSIMEFSRADWYWTIGVACIPLGFITVVVGVSRFWRMRSSISVVRRQSSGSATDTTHEV